MALNKSTWASIIALGAFYFHALHFCWIALLVTVVLRIWEDSK